MNKRKIFWIAVALVLLLIGFRVINRVRSQTAKVKERPIAVVAKPPSVGPIENKLTLTGDIKGSSELAVKPTNSGRIEEIYVREGDLVSRGDKLMSYVAGISETDEMFEDVVTFAPISGYIGMQNIRLGDQATAGLTTVFNIYTIDRVKIYVDVPEKDYSMVKRGTPARITLDAYPDAPVNASVSNIRPAIDPYSRTAQAEIDIANASHRIRPGMFARVDLVLGRKSSALLLPSDSVLSGADKYIYLAKEGKAVRMPVKTGYEDSGLVEIVSGLSPSDKVIVSGQRVVKEGSSIVEASDD